MVFLGACVGLHALQHRFLPLVALVQVTGVSLNQWASPKETAPAQPTAGRANQSPPAQPTVLEFCPLSSLLLSSSSLSSSSSFSSSSSSSPSSLHPFILSPSSFLLPTVPLSLAVYLHCLFNRPLVIRLAISTLLVGKEYLVCGARAGHCWTDIYKEPILLTSPKDSSASIIPVVSLLILSCRPSHAVAILFGSILNISPTRNLIWPLTITSTLDNFLLRTFFLSYCWFNEDQISRLLDPDYSTPT